MNRDNKLRKNKLLFGKSSVTSQIVDYYNRFGQNRDLEQYLTFSNPTASHKCPSIHSDTTSNFSTARCLFTDGENHSDCFRKEKIKQRLIESDSDESCMTKYQIKPLEPVYYSTDKPSTSADSKDLKTKTITIKFDSQTKLDVQDSDGKSDDSSREVVSGPLDDVHQNLDSSLNKVGSPTNSITSRRLEWDSMADVGYANVGRNEHPHQNLSTLERMALDRHIKSENNIPESEGNAHKQSVSMEANFTHVGLPDAQSTPILISRTESPRIPVKQKSILRTSSHRNSSGDRKSGKRLSSGDGFQKPRTSSSNSNNFKIDLTKHFSINVDINKNTEYQKKSQADDDIKHDNVECVPLQHNESFELNEDNIQIYKPSVKEHSNDTPDESVVLDDTPTSDKEIQTSSRQNVSTSAQTSSRLLKNSQEDEYQPIPNTLPKGTVILNVVRSSSKPVYRTKKKKIFSQPLNVTLCNITHKSADRKDIDEEKDVDLDGTNSSGIEQDNSPIKCSESLLSTAESFEYMPGHMYQSSPPPLLHDKVSSLERLANDDRKIDIDRMNSLAVEPDDSPLKSLPQSSLDVTSPLTSSSSFSGGKDKDDFINFEMSSCFSRDLNIGVDSIRNLLATRQNDPKLRKKLIKHLIKMLVKSDYAVESGGDSARHVYSDKLSSTGENNVNLVPTVKRVPEKLDHIGFDETDILLRRTAYHKQIFIKSQSTDALCTKDKLLSDNIPKLIHSAPSSLAIDTKPKNSCILPVEVDQVKETYERSVQPSVYTNSSPESELHPSKSESAKDLQHKISTDNKYTWTSLIDSMSSSDSIIETHRQLAIINDEIEKLNLLKSKLKSKRKKKDSGDVELNDVPTSGEKITKNLTERLLEKIQSLDIGVTSESSKIVNVESSTPNVHIPLLNFKKSSDDSSMNTLSITEDLSVESSSNRDTKTILVQTANAKSDINEQKVIPRKYVKSGKENKNVENDVFGNPFGILCSCCRSNLPSSQSSSQSSKHSANDYNVSANSELRKLKKVYSKFQKCKVMKSFMNDYDNLVKKYQKIKEDKGTKNVCKCTTDDERKAQTKSNDEKVGNISNLHLIKLNEKLKKFNEGIAEDQFKIKLISNTDDDDSLKSVSLSGGDMPHGKENKSSINILSEKGPCTMRSQITNSTKGNSSSVKVILTTTDRDRTKSGRVDTDYFENNVSKTIFVDANTSPMILQGVEIGNDLKSETIKSDSTDLNLSNNFISKVKKVITPDYEELAKKVDYLLATVEFQNRKTLMSTPASKNITEDLKQPVETPSMSNNKMTSGSESTDLCIDDKVTGKSSKKSDKRTPQSISADNIKKNIPKEATVSKSQCRKKATSKFENLSPKTDVVVFSICKCHKRLETRKYDDEKGSTDEQIEEFSSLNKEYSGNDYPSDGSGMFSSHVGSENEYLAISNSMTIEEYLRKNRPQFISKADKRQESLRRLHFLRVQNDAQRKRVLALGVSNLPNIKDISTSDLHQLAKQYGIAFSDTGKNRIFNTNTMVRNTTRQYKKLPEVQNKKLVLKKERSKKINTLMADLFAKKLREKALKGVVNISYSSNIVTI